MRARSKILLLCLASLLASACSSERNPRACIDGVCPDPAFPYCDYSGELEGAPRTCIAVSCTPDEFVTCRADEELHCNAAGTSYEQTRCERGCSDATAGCRLCDPNETACTNGEVATCDAAGNIVSATRCPLGCFEYEPRCRQVDPSNGLGLYFDMVASPPDLDLDLAEGTIYTATGEVFSEGTLIANIPTFLVPARSGATPIRVLVVGNARLGDVRVQRDADDTALTPAQTGPALAILAAGDITITGRVSATGGVGALDSGTCVGVDARSRYTGGGGPDGGEIFEGSGGGAHAGGGAKGGEIIDYYPGAAGGGANGTETLVPLRGGCRSGAVRYPTSQLGNPSPGGGAIQLTAQGSIDIVGTIDVRGTSGLTLSVGGGAGGSVLIEAPRVTLRDTARIIAIGGAGASGRLPTSLPSPVDTGESAAGMPCSEVGIYCGVGGAGASVALAATNGGPASYRYEDYSAAGGGGGGVGRIRINTPDRTYTKSSLTIEAGSSSVGTLSTR